MCYVQSRRERQARFGLRHREDPREKIRARITTTDGPGAHGVRPFRLLTKAWAPRREGDDLAHGWVRRSTLQQRGTRRAAASSYSLRSPQRRHNWRSIRECPRDRRARYLEGDCDGPDASALGLQSASVGEGASVDAPRTSPTTALGFDALAGRADAFANRQALGKPHAPVRGRDVRARVVLAPSCRRAITAPPSRVRCYG